MITHGSTSRKVAVIDVGSDSTRLLIAAVNDERLCPLVRRQRITQLAPVLKGRLNAARVTAVLATVKEYAALVAHAGAPPTRAVLTAAAREAADGLDLLRRIETLGVSARILDPRSEAILAARGALLGEPESGGWLVVDIGGASTEFALASSDGLATATTSLGTSRLVREFRAGGHEALTTRIRAEVRRAAGELCAAPPPVILAAADFPSWQQLLAFAPGVPRDDRARPIIERTLCKDAHRRLAAVNDEECRALGVDRRRLDTLVVGTCLLESIMDVFEHDEVRIATAGLLEGALLAFAEELENSA